MKKIGSKIRIMMLVLILIFVANGAVALYSHSQIAQAGYNITDYAIPVQNDIFTIQKSVERGQKYLNIICLYDNAELRAGLEESLGNEIEAISSEEEKIKALLEKLADKDLQESYLAYEEYLNQVTQMFESIQAYVDDGDFVSANMALSGDFQNLVTTTGQETENKLTEKMDECISGSAKKYNTAMTFSRNMTIFLLIVFIIVSIVISIILRKTVSNPAKEASGQLHKIIGEIHKGEGNLTERITVTSKDEIGQLSAGINDFMLFPALMQQKIEECMQLG